MTPLLRGAWKSAHRWRPNLLELAIRLAVPAAMLLASVLTSTLSGDRGAAPETLFLAVWAAAVFTPLAFLDTASRPVHAALGLAAAACIATLPRSAGLRPVAVSAVLALSVAIFATLALRKTPDLRTSAALALAAAFVLHGHRLFLHGLSLRTLVLLALLPGAAAAAGASLAAGGRAGAGLAAALALLLAPQLASEPWWIVLGLATTALFAAFGSGPGARVARRVLFFFAAATLLAGSFPWLRRAPVATLLGAVTTLDRPVAESALGERVVVLTRSSPRLEVDLSGAWVRSLVIDSYLTNGVDLACGQAFAGLELQERGEEVGKVKTAKAPWRAQMVAGRDSAEWAAARPDVAARLGCPAPPPWISWIPGAGRFLGQTTRARFGLPSIFDARHLVIERSPGLPPETSLAIFFVATER